MTSRWALAICLTVGAALTIGDADARRLGGSRSIGVQRSVTAPPVSRPARPAPQQAAPQQNPAAQQQGVPPPQPASGMSRWLPMFGGLALGGLLGSLFGGSGLGGILLVALLVMVAVIAFRALAGRRTQEAAQPLQMAGAEPVRVVATPPAQAASEPAPISAVSIPAGFDTAGFLRAAKTNFIKLQVANDLGRLDEIRELTTREMYDELRRDMVGRGSAAQQTDVTSLDADLLEVATEREQHWASVRFSGTVRESRTAAPESFEEVWNLVKPSDGSSGWLLAGIQQMH